jgi:hypothetical protein
MSAAIQSDEPIIHSHMDDSLPETHPLAHEQVGCVACGDLVHAFNNECMTTWVEVRGKPFCLKCFMPCLGPVLSYAPIIKYLSK